MPRRIKCPLPFPCTSEGVLGFSLVRDFSSRWLGWLVCLARRTGGGTVQLVARPELGLPALGAVLGLTQLVLLLKSGLEFSPQIPIKGNISSKSPPQKGEISASKHQIKPLILSTYYVSENPAMPEGRYSCWPDTSHRNQRDGSGR